MSGIVENPEKDWIKAVMDLELSIHPDSLRKSFNVGRYCGYNVMKYFQNKITQEMSNDEIERVQLARDELYKERCRLSDINRDYSKKLREQARFESLLDTLKNEINNLDKITLNDFKPQNSKTKITGVLQLSDWHVLKMIDNQWNYYDKDTAIKRANIIADKAIQKSKLHNVTDLVVEINGDIIEGIIQVSARSATEADIIQQIVFASELLSQVINKMKPYYEGIKVVTTLGNHGRVYESKKLGTTKENFEMLIPEFLKLRLDNSVNIIKSYGLDFTSYEIDGELICVAHGQNDKISTVITDFAKIYKRVPKEIHLGHFHSYKDINDCDIYVTVNGSLSGADDFSLTLRKITKPAQNFIVYDTDRCIYNLIAE